MFSLFLFQRVYVFFVSLSESVLLVHRNATYFFMFILYPETFLNPLISFNSFVIEYWGFLDKTVCNQQTKKFISSFTIWMLDAFFFLIALTQTLNMMLNRTDKSGHSCVPNLRGKGFNFSLLSMMLSVGLLYIVFTVLIYVQSIFTWLRISIIKGY